MKYVASVFLMLCSFSVFGQTDKYQTYYLDFDEFHNNDSLMVWKHHAIDTAHIYVFGLYLNNHADSKKDRRIYDKIIRVAKDKRNKEFHFVFIKEPKYPVGKFKGDRTDGFNILEIYAYETSRFWRRYPPLSKEDSVTLMEKRVLILKGRNKGPGNASGITIPRGFKLPIPPLPDSLKN